MFFAVFKLTSNTYISTRWQIDSIAMPLSILKISIITTAIIISNSTFAIWLTVFHFSFITKTIYLIHFTFCDLSINKISYEFCSNFVCQDALTVWYLIYHVSNVFCAIFEIYYTWFYFTFWSSLKNLFQRKLWIFWDYLEII